MRRLAAPVLAAALALAGAAPASAAPRSCDEPTRGWQRIAPAAAGLDAGRLDRAIHAYQDRRGYAVRVYRRGCLVGTDTNDPFTRRAQFEGWGLTRALTSLLAGRAMELGALDPEDPVGALVPQADAAHGAIRVRDLLGATSGLRAGGLRDEELVRRDTLHDALVTEVAHRPGTRFHESVGAGALLVAVLEAAVGQDLQAFAQGELLGPLGIRPGTWRWERDTVGRPQGTFGVNMVADDFARLGELLRRGGVWNGRRLLSERYVRAALEPSEANPCLGWLVWVNAGRRCTRIDDGKRTTAGDRLLPGSPADTWQFRGRFDQFVTVFPALELMVVRTGTRGGDNRSSDDGGTWERGVALQLLDAVTDAQPQRTTIRRDAPVEQTRPQDGAPRGSDSFGPWFPPPLPPAGPYRARAVLLDQPSTSVRRRRLVPVGVRCPGASPRPCEVALTVEDGRGPRQPLIVAPGTRRVALVRVAKGALPRTTTARATSRDAAGGTTTLRELALTR